MIRFRRRVRFVKRAADPAMSAFVEHWRNLPKQQRHAAMLPYVSSKAFHKAVARDRKVPAALRRQVDLLYKQETLAAKAQVRATRRSAGGKDGRKFYRISRDPGRRRWMCTCPDWRWRRSWLPDSSSAAQKNCKHIKQYLKR